MADLGSVARRGIPRGESERMGRWIVAAVLAALMSGCSGGGQPAPEARPDALALLAAGSDTVPLDTQLTRLDGLAGAALNAAGVQRQSSITEMEVLSDGLLESQLPFRRLAGGYSLESRLRQLQALADRIDAEAQRGEEPDSVRADLRSMRYQVQELRRALTRPGAPVLPPIDSLLSAWDAAHPAVRSDMETSEPETDRNHGVAPSDTAVKRAGSAPDTTGVLPAGGRELR
jgi:hypothetical protein